MNEMSDQALLEVGRSAAASVPELGEIGDIEVSGIIDSSNEFTYLFSFVLDRQEDDGNLSVGRAYIHLSQALRDGLMDRGDDRFPLIRLFTKEDWAKRKLA